MPKYTTKGQTARVRRVAATLLRTRAGAGRISLALGSRDPRNHRTPQGAQATERQFHPEFFTVDDEGRLRPKG